MAQVAVCSQINTKHINTVWAERCVELATLPPPCAICLEILGASTTWSPKSVSRLVEGVPNTVKYASQEI